MAQLQHDEGVSGERPPTATGLVIDCLARLPAKAMLDEAKLAQALHVTSRTIRRMVARRELPPPVQLGGRNLWMAGRILEHIEKALKPGRRSGSNGWRRDRTYSVRTSIKDEF